MWDQTSYESWECETRPAKKSKGCETSFESLGNVRPDRLWKSWGCETRPAMKVPGMWDQTSYESPRDVRPAMNVLGMWDQTSYESLGDVRPDQLWKPWGCETSFESPGDVRPAVKVSGPDVKRRGWITRPATISKDSNSYWAPSALSVTAAMTSRQLPQPSNIIAEMKVRVVKSHSLPSL